MMLNEALNLGNQLMLNEEEGVVYDSYFTVTYDNPYKLFDRRNEVWFLRMWGTGPVIYLRGDIKGFTDLQLTLDVYFDVVYFMFDILLDLWDLTYTLTLFRTLNLTIYWINMTLFSPFCLPPPHLTFLKVWQAFSKW